MILTYTGLFLIGPQDGMTRTVTSWARFASAAQLWARSAAAWSPVWILPSVLGAVALASLILTAWHRLRTRREARKLREELAAQLARAEAAEFTNAAKTEFLGSISHQIRTPLNAIMGFTELALKTDLAPALREYLDTVRTSADRLLHTVDEISEFSQLEAGTLKLENVPFSLSECIVSAMKGVEAEARAKKLNSATKIDSRLPGIVRGDPARLRHIVFNLVDNAVRFTTSGSVIVSAALESDAGDHVLMRLSVTDTGIGITPAKQQQIFEPFRVDQGAALNKSQAAVVGLAASRRLVELMGGTITLQSQLGAGTTFEFTARFEKETGADLKTTPRGEDPEAPVRTPERLGPQQLSILVVDDDAVSRHLVSRVFESAGHRVWVAEDGEHALLYTRTEAFDLIFMDLEMPGLNGLEVTREIRKNEAPCVRVPVYALTAHASSTDREKCIEAGMDGFLTKPVAVDQLVKLVSKVVPGVSSVCALDSALTSPPETPAVPAAHDQETTSPHAENRCAPASEIAPVEKVTARAQAVDAGADLIEPDLKAIWKNPDEALMIDAADTSSATQTAVETCGDLAGQESSRFTLYATGRDVLQLVSEPKPSNNPVSDSEAGQESIAPDRTTVSLGLALLQSTAEWTLRHCEENSAKIDVAMPDPFEQARKALCKSRFDVRVIHNNGDPSDRNLI